MRFLASAVGLAILSFAINAWCAGVYTVYSWEPKVQTSVVADRCDSFTQARQAAETLSVVHSLHQGPRLDSGFEMINDSNQPLMTWVLHADEPFEPHEYIWVGDKKNGASAR